MHVEIEIHKNNNRVKMLEGKGMIKETDMPVKMQIHAMASASQALDLYDVSDCISIAAHIKKVRVCVRLQQFSLFNSIDYCVRTTVVVLVFSGI